MVSHGMVTLGMELFNQKGVNHMKNYYDEELTDIANASAAGLEHDLEAINDARIECQRLIKKLYAYRRRFRSDDEVERFEKVIDYLEKHDASLAAKEMDLEAALQCDLDLLKRYI